METINGAAQKAAREIMICGRASARTYGHVTVPEIRLMGIWLTELGFDVGDRIKIECQNQKMTISLADVQPWREERQRQALTEARKEAQFDRMLIHLNNIDHGNETNTQVRYVR